MVRLTADVLTNAPSFLNPLNLRELDLRGYKIPAIENLGVTRDQNECIDFTDNDLRHLGNFPTFKRLKSLLCARNRISSISPTLADTLPNLQVLVLTGNALQELTDLDALRGLRELHTLVCLDNPVTRNPHYRPWLIWRCKGLRVLDFRRVKQEDRRRANDMFGSVEEPTPLAAELLGIKSKTFDVGGSTQESGKGYSQLGRITEDERRRITLAIQNATTMAEVQRLELLLLEGRVPDAPMSDGQTV